MKAARRMMANHAEPHGRENAEFRGTESRSLPPVRATAAEGEANHDGFAVKVNDDD